MHFEDEMLEKLILDGVVEFAGVDKNGELLYSFAEDLETKAPEMFRMAQQMHMNDIYYLWEKGFLSMDATQQNPIVNITKLALNREEVTRLPDHLQLLLEQIMDAMRDRSGE